MGKGYIVRRGGTAEQSEVHYSLLYHNGDECIETSGGWSAYSKSNQPQYAAFRSVNQFNLNDYTKALLVALAYGTVPVVYAMHSVKDALSERSPLNLAYTENGTKNSTLMDVVATGKQYVYLGTTWSSGSGNTITTTKKSTYLDTGLKDASDQRGGYVYTFALFKADDWQTWMALGGVAGFDSVDRLVADQTAMNTLLANKEACEFMIEKCTGDVMASAIMSSVFKTALNNSVYKNDVYANEHWAKFLAMV